MADEPRARRCGGFADGFLEYLALDHRRSWSCCCCSAAAARFPMLMGDVAQGIKAFKKGMSDDDKAERTPKAEPEDHRSAGSADPKHAKPSGAPRA